MKIISIIRKSFLEQLRSYWVLLLTVAMGPFFMMVYFLIIETSKPHYNLAIINNDKGIQTGQGILNYGDQLIQYLDEELPDTFSVPFSVHRKSELTPSLDQLKSGKIDALIVLPVNFSKQLSGRSSADSSSSYPITCYGDLTNTNYMITAIWANEMVRSFINYTAHIPEVISMNEVAIGSSGTVDDFDLMVPGILIISIIMLMFTASIAFVTEVENKTIIRLKLSDMTGFQYLVGVSVIQLGVGVISLLLTLLVAIAMGFEYSAPLLTITGIALLTSLSIIAFSLIIASFTKSANEVLVVGNFPLFLFMFFSGAAFPLEGKPLFSLAGYPITLQGLMSPTHAISALKKLLIMNANTADVLSEILALVVLTIIYFAIGLYFFQRRHLSLKTN